MRAYDIIQKKRDGKELTKEEIDFFVGGYMRDEIKDYQAAAFCMAVYFRGMTPEETASFTFAIRDSGERADFSQISGIRADKHSTGGVGDKTSLVVAPIVASCGVKVAKISGRGLGHTGGTIDKLESIGGFRTDLDEKTFIDVVNDCGMAIIGQNAVFAPADKKFYALRDVTATVDSIPLIASSIMGKKLASDDDCIVLDVKTGSGAFMKTQEKSEELARVMTDIGKRAGKKICALVTDMDEPLGYAVGNALEVKEAVETLQGKGERRFTALCIALATKMLFLAGKGSEKECERLVFSKIIDGSALKTLARFVRAQGGDEEVVFTPEKIAFSPEKADVLAEKDGFIVQTSAEEYGKAALLLGAGRNTMEDKIDFGAGILIKKKVGDRVKKGDVIATLYSSKNDFETAQEIISSATKIGDERPKERPIVLKTIE